MVRINLHENLIPYLNGSLPEDLLHYMHDEKSHLPVGHHPLHCHGGGQPPGEPLTSQSRSIRTSITETDTGENGFQEDLRQYLQW
jgi:hypothetical protein